MRAEETIRLGSRAREILLMLLERRGELVTKRELIERVWPRTAVEEGTLRVHITLLRKALGDGQDGVLYIENLSGVGYRFIAPVTRIEDAEIPAERLERGAPLPSRLAHMHGRDEVVAELSAQMLRERFVTVVGPGGMGKTTVAIAVAHRISPQFSGNVVFCDLEPVVDAGLLPSALATYLGMAVPGDDLIPALIAFLRTRQLLLVLDNCEHVIESVASLAARIFNAAPQVHLLATSREALRVEGEHVYLLPPLATPSGMVASAAEALTYPAVQLFMERAAAGGSRFELHDVDAPVVAAVSRKLDGIPLALELAGGRVGALGLRGIDELLSSRLEFPWHARRTLPPRHRTLEALLDWSYKPAD